MEIIYSSQQHEKLVKFLFRPMSDMEKLELKVAIFVLIFIQLVLIFISLIIDYILFKVLICSSLLIIFGYLFFVYKNEQRFIQQSILSKNYYVIRTICTNKYKYTIRGKDGNYTKYKTIFKDIEKAYDTYEFEIGEEVDLIFIRDYKYNKYKKLKVKLYLNPIKSIH